MLRAKAALALWLAFGCAAGLWAQPRTDTLRNADTLHLSQPFPAPGSVMIRFLPSGRTWQPPLAAQVRDRVGVDSLYRSDSLAIVIYRVLRQPPPIRIQLRDFQAVKDTTREAWADVIFPETDAKPPPFWMESGGLRTTGSLSRGITVGNNRGLALNSGLRLQIEGDLGDGLKITGAITDENIPIQPDGTTQAINDFDRVFIRLAKDAYSVTLGDYEVLQKGSRFADYYRNVQGIRLAVEQKKQQAAFSMAVAKGKFHSNTFQGQDGVAGPYQLSGQNGERFIFILAGSERVFLNGQPMRRGENLDYVIDYNTAEVTFTANHVITNISRIVVDFEYNDQYYNRSLIVGEASGSALKDRLKVNFSYARDADNANAPFNDAAGFASIRDTLASLGDQQGPALTSGVSLTGPSVVEGEVRYRRADTLVAGVLYERYVYARDTSAKYQAAFSFVGRGNGFYVRRSDLNGNIYAWQPPDANGRPTGDFAPVRIWVLPRLLQVSSLRASLQVTPKARVYTEVALSSEDKNRLSALGDEDNLAAAQHSGIQFSKVRLADSVFLEADVSYQFVARRYVNLDRVYRAEYGRVWNFNDLGQRTQEHVTLARTALRFKRLAELSMEHGMRATGPGQRNYRQTYTLSSQLPWFLHGSYTFTDLSTEVDSASFRSRWMRHEGDLFRTIGRWRAGTVIWIENRREATGDTLRGGTFNFQDLKPYLRREGEKFSLETSYNYRFDREWLQGQVREKSLGQTAFLRTRYQPSQALNLQAVTSYRTLQVRDTAFRTADLQNTRTLNANLQGDYMHRKRLLTTQLVYEVASERLAAREVRFVRVPAGQGQYVWLDSLFNNDGIEDIEEFQVANNPLVADFVRILVPTRTLVPTTRLSFSGNMRWDLRQVIKPGGSFWKEAARRFQSLTAFRIVQNQQRQSGFSSYLIGLGNVFEDTTLLDASYSFRQDFTFFQNSPVGEFKFGYLDNQTRSFLITGSEERGNRVGNAYQRVNAGTKVSFEADTRLGRRFTVAEAFESRNFNIRYWETFPRANYQVSRQLRLSGGYEYKRRVNEGEAGQEASVNIHKAVFESRWNIKERNNLFVKLELAGLAQEGEAGFSADFELKEGLAPGFNTITQVFLTWYLFGNLELSLNYDGRAAVDRPVVHTGRVQVRAFF